MKIGDVRAMSPDEVEDKILELKKEQFNLRFQRATGHLESTSRVRVVRRKTIAAKPMAAKPAKEKKPAAEKAAAKPTAKAKKKGK